MENKVTDWVQRFWEKVDRRGLDECWPWLAGKTGTGYGAFVINDESGKKIQKKATHVMWFLTHGVWPTNNMCHTCDNPPCVNPNHLFDGDNFDNMRDCANKGRSFLQRKGDQHPRSVLTNEQVVSIRAEYVKYSRVHGIGALGKKYGVNPATIWYVVNNRTFVVE